MTFLALGAFDLPWGKLLEMKVGFSVPVPCNSVLGGALHVPSQPTLFLRSHW